MTRRTIYYSQLQRDRVDISMCTGCAVMRFVWFIVLHTLEVVGGSWDCLLRFGFKFIIAIQSASNKNGGKHTM